VYNLALALTTQADSPPPSPNSLALATLLRRVNLELGCSLRLRVFGLGLVQDGKVRVGDLLDFPAQSGCAGRFMNFELTRSGGETVAVWPSGPNFLLQCARHLLKQGPSPKSSELSNTQDKG